MKKDQQKVIDLPITGRDEINLIECPLTLLTEGSKKNQTLKFADIQQGITRHWKIIGSGEYGLPCALDEPVFIAMLFLTKRDRFNSQRVFFNQLEMLKLMRWPINGEHYHRLSLAFSRLATVTIETDYLWNRGNFEKGKFIFHIIDRAGLYQGKRKNTKSSWFQWGEDIFKSFQAGNLKNLNLDVYFDLKTPISRRFFRLWDKRLYKRDQVSFDLKDLCHEKLGISRNLIYPSLLKQALNPALKEHKEKKLLSSATYIKKKDGNWMLNIKRYRENPEPLPDIPSGSAETPKDDSLLEKLLLLKIPTNKANILLRTYPRELTEGWIIALDMVKPQPRNKAGYLLKALEEKWELPEEVRKKREAEEQEREEKLKAEYDEYILVQVDEYLKTLDPEQVEKEIAAHKEVYFNKLPPHFKEDLWESEGMKPRIERDYKLSKATELKLPTFEQWREE